LARTHDLVAFETYLPDLAAHSRLAISLAEALAIVDAFAAHLIKQRAPADTMILASDHGNSEDSASTTHTRNPVPLLVAGPAATHFQKVQSIDQIAPTVLET
jgi:phosphopentomutase